MEHMESLIKFLRNQFRDGFFNGKLLNPKDVSDPIANAIKYGAELNAQVFESSFDKISQEEGVVSKEIKKELKDGVEKIVRAKLTKESVDFLNKLEFVKGDKGDKGDRGDKGEPGYTPVKGKDYFDGKDGKSPTKVELKKIIEPLIPEPVMGDNGIDGKDGKNGKDGSPDTAQQVKEKLESLDGEERLDAKAIKNLPKVLKHFGGRGRADVWINGDGSTTNRLVVSAIAPASPILNDLWIDIS